MSKNDIRKIFNAGVSHMMSTREDFESKYPSFNEWWGGYLRNKYPIEDIARKAYEDNEIGGVQNWGTWCEAPEAVRQSHRNLTLNIIQQLYK